MKQGAKKNVRKVLLKKASQLIEDYKQSAGSHQDLRIRLQSMHKQYIDIVNALGEFEGYVSDWQMQVIHQAISEAVDKNVRESSLATLTITVYIKTFAFTETYR